MSSPSAVELAAKLNEKGVETVAINRQWLTFEDYGDQVFARVTHRVAFAAIAMLDASLIASAEEAAYSTRRLIEAHGVVKTSLDDLPGCTQRDARRAMKEAA